MRFASSTDCRSVVTAETNPFDEVDEGANTRVPRTNCEESAKEDQLNARTPSGGRVPAP